MNDLNHSEGRGAFKGMEESEKSHEAKLANDTHHSHETGNLFLKLEDSSDLEESGTLEGTLDCDSQWAPDGLNIFSEGFKQLLDLIHAPRVDKSSVFDHLERMRLMELPPGSPNFFAFLNQKTILFSHFKEQPPLELPIISYLMALQGLKSDASKPSIMGQRSPFEPLPLNSKFYHSDGGFEMEDLHHLIASFVHLGVDVNARATDGTSALFVATLCYDIPLLKLLLDLGADIELSCQGKTSLHMAIILNYPPLSRFLLERGADVNLRVANDDADSPVTLVIKHSLDPVILHLLLCEYQADFDLDSIKSILSGSSEDTLLHRLAIRRDLPWPQTSELIGLLIQKGVNPELLNENGWSALHITAGRGHFPFVAALLKHGACPHQTTRSGLTALHMATLNNNLEVMKLLITQGSNPLVKNNEGYLASDLAVTAGHSEAYAYLKTCEQVLLEHQMLQDLLPPLTTDRPPFAL